MNSNLFSLNWKNVFGAVVSAIIVAVLAYAVSVGDLWKLSGHAIVNIGAFAGIASLLKAFATDSSGSFLGAIPVK